jgi:hypothetical protein
MMEYWNIGIMGSKRKDLFSLRISVEPDIPSFHYSILPIG